MTPARVASISRQMAALRDALVLEKRKRSSSQDPKAGRALLLIALRRLARDADLTVRIARCGSRAHETAKRFDCGSAACPVCTARGAAREFKRTIAPALAKLDRDRLRYITILHLVSADLDEGFRAMRGREHRALQSIVRATGIRWWGWREIELLRPADLLTFSDRKRATLRAMGLPESVSGPVALMHSHSIVDCADCDHDTLDTLLRGRWGAPRQVHIQSLMQQRALVESLRRMTIYSIKARYTRTVGEDRREWLDEAEMVHLAQFMHRSSRGHQALRFTFNVRGSSNEGALLRCDRSAR